MQKLNDYIEEKKIKSSKTPRYGMKKLAVGLVSCILGYTVLVSPSVAYAEEVREPQAMVMEAEEEVKEETEEEKEEETEKKLVTLDEYNVLQEEENEEDGINIEDAELVSNVLGVTGDETEGEIELGEEVDPESQTAGETSEEAQREPKDISNEIQDRQVHLNIEKLLEDENKRIKEENARITEKNKKRPSFDQLPLIPEATEETIHPDDGEPIGYEVAFTSPRGSIGGDNFTIKLSDNLKIQGIEPYTTKVDPLIIGKDTIATGERINNQTIKYTFTDKINDIRNVRVSIKGYAYVDKTKVPNTGKENFSVALGDKKDEKSINVNYGDVYYTGEKLNGESQITYYNPEKGEFTQVFYINPDSKEISNSTKDIFAGKVLLFIDGFDDYTKKQSDVSYNKDNTEVIVQKIAPNTNMPDAIFIDPASDKNKEEATVLTKFRNQGIEITFSDIKDNKLSNQKGINSPYIVTVKSKIPVGTDKKDVNIVSRGTLYGDGNKFHIMNNEIVSVVGDNEAQGQQVGYFIEHHVYKTKVDGVLQEDKTFTIHSNKMEGADYDDYFTDKSEIEDFKFVEVDTNKIKEGAAYNADGSVARGNYEPGKTKEVTYIYVRDIKHGTFQEHHIYQSIDEDGNVVAEETVNWNSDETTGFDETSYDTSKKDKDKKPVTSEVDSYGYKLISVKASGNSDKKDKVKFNSEGAATKGNYVNGEKLEVTYTYQKKVITKGNFIEHHIYQTVDEDDKVISTDDTVDKDPTTGKETEKYTTAKEDRDGYKLTKVESKEKAKFNEDGSKAEGNYVKGKTQEVTYTYQKKVITKGSFQEHHIYITKDKDGKETGRTSDDGEVKVGKKDENYTTGKIEKDGFKFVRTENPVETPSYNEQGETKEGNFKPGVKQEITYVYEKTVTPWTPLTPAEKPKEDPTPTPDPTPEKPEEPTPTPVIHEEEKPNPTPTPRHEDPTPTPEETPVEEPKEDPAPKEEPKTEESKEEETPEETPVEEAKEEEKEVVVEKEEDDETDRLKDTTPKHEGKEDYSKAPQTGVAGAAGYLGLAGLGTALLAALEDKKKKKNK